ncbi:MAG TPA: STAS domain-containing protein [Jatrophihabitantaceae bacterium]|jgi:anti-anti-sigma regulatory factor|nr:STAS domain-containing protein [Jatrophihabitantaceae bacterium]
MTEAASLPNGALRCSVDDDGSRVTVWLRGRLDLDTVWTLGAELSALIRAGRRHLTVDVGECAAVSPVCVGVLNRTVGELKSAHGVLALRGLSEAALQRLRTAGLHPAVRTSPRHLDLI